MINTCPTINVVYFTQSRVNCIVAAIGSNDVITAKDCTINQGGSDDGIVAVACGNIFHNFNALLVYVKGDRCSSQKLELRAKLGNK
ncbi:hypothetical protein OGM63_12765 [Plectonema radiosum NIES-515]|uniref:Uncharacterized protein n=1 Tax=Plectonema radiosum NIES-515 TaxID=2986073 RepID=A0ABT3AZ14_9CYAN|nr:hypothetical protein [Plectonema radiosum]MCV3214372.1 hypothetical protein [Plectonema radiosum NIES-515]